MSIKKLHFLPDFTALSDWGRRGEAFVALVDFGGHLLAAPVGVGEYQGEVQLRGAKLHFRFPLPLAAKNHSMGLPLLWKNRAATDPSYGKTGPMPAPAMEKRSPPSIEAPLAMEKQATASINQAPPIIELVTPPEKARLVNTIRQLQQELRAGYSYLANICSQTMVASPLGAEELYSQAKSPFAFWLEGHFLSFTPEAFVTIEGNTISTYPMKGTGFDRDALLADSKEQAEHATIVDLLRNDLGRVAERVVLRRYRFVSEIVRDDGSRLYQTSSHITGTMPANWRSTIGDWLPQLLPAGSVTGAPKKETVELIRRYETTPRGFFTGVALLFDGQNLYSAVLIRYIDIAGERWYYRSGAGITVYSDPEREYEEILHKVYIPI